MRTHVTFMQTIAVDSEENIEAQEAIEIASQERCRLLDTMSEEALLGGIVEVPGKKAKVQVIGVQVRSHDPADEIAMCFAKELKPKGGN